MPLYSPLPDGLWAVNVFFDYLSYLLCIHRRSYQFEGQFLAFLSLSDLQQLQRKQTLIGLTVSKVCKLLGLCWERISECSCCISQKNIGIHHIAARN